SPTCPRRQPPVPPQMPARRQAARLPLRRLRLPLPDAHCARHHLSSTNSQKQKRRGAATRLAIPLPESSPRRRRALPPRRPRSAISLAEQLAQHPPFEVGRRALRAASRPEELQVHRLEVELLAAGRAFFQVL